MADLNNDVPNFSASKNAFDDSACDLFQLERAMSLTSISSAKEKFDADLLLTTELTKVDCNFGKVSPQMGTSYLQSVVRHERKQAKSDVVILYAIRHPACGACRQKGKALADYVASDRNATMVTVVKDTGKTDKSLLTYYTKYGNRTPIYVDPAWGIYKAMGGRKVKFGLMVRKIPGQMIRCVRKGVTPNIREVIKSDLWTSGGVLFFDRKGSFVHGIYEPRFGDELDMNEVEKAVRRVRAKNLTYTSKEKATSSSGTADIDSIEFGLWED